MKRSLAIPCCLALILGLAAAAPAQEYELLLGCPEYLQASGEVTVEVTGYIARGPQWPGLPDPKGWSLSATADCWEIIGVTVVGTVAETSLEGGFHSSHLTADARALYPQAGCGDLVDGVRLYDGATSAIYLDLVEDTTLDELPGALPPYDVVKFTLRATGPAPGEDPMSCCIQYEDGCVPSTTPVLNSVARLGTTYRPPLTECCTVIEPVRSGGQLPADCNQDGSFDISDGICLLGSLFLNTPARLPCGDGTIGNLGNVSLLDSNGDGTVDLSDCVSVFGFLFLGGPPPAAGHRCVGIPGCPEVCSVAPEDPCGLVDQYQLLGDMLQVINSTRSVGQTFTVQRDGVLKTLELALFGIGSGGRLEVELLDLSTGDLADAPVIATIRIPEFEIGGEVIRELQLGSITGLAVPLFPFDIQVRRGDRLAFRLSTERTPPNRFLLAMRAADEVPGGQFFVNNSFGGSSDAVYKLCLEP